MAERDFIPRKPLLDPAEDFARLRREGLRWIESLGSERWTDYNIHDPGVTILESMCYAITDLGYRTGYPLRDLLTEEVQGVAVNRSQFHTAYEVLTCNPVSFDDLRKLLIDIRGVRNAWIEKHIGVEYGLDFAKGRLVDATAGGVLRNPPLNGLYDVYIEYEEEVEEEPRRYSLGAPAWGAQGGYAEPGKGALKFRVERPLTLVSASVYAETAGPVRVRLLDGRRRVLARADSHVAAAGEKTVVPLGFGLAAGQEYAIDGFGSSVKLYRDEAPPPAAVTSLSRRISLKAGAYTAGQTLYPCFYDLQVADAESNAEARGALSPLTREQVRFAVKERLSRHRNLCEDFVNICDLDKEEVALCADIELAPSADVEGVQAEIFYRVGLHVSPPVRFYTIDELRAKGHSTDAIFEGPRLEHGFIDDEEFQRMKRRCEIRSSDVVQILMNIPGIVAIRKIDLLGFIDGIPRPPQPWVLPLSTDRFRGAAFAGDKSKIIFYKHDLPYYANRQRVKELLLDKRGSDAYQKLKDHQRDLPIPVGEAKGLADYVPAQHDLPAAYAAGRHRVAESDTALRRAQSRQLKAYLLFFEQMLANGLAQLAHLRQLFSWETDTDRTYFSQAVTDLAEVEQLYAEGLLQGDAAGLQQALDKIAESDADAEKRRLRFLEHLNARFAENFGEYGRLMGSLFGDTARKRLIADQRAFLADYPALSRSRGTAYDYRFPTAAHNVSGYQRRVCRLLGIREFSRRRLAGRRLVIEATKYGGNDAWRFVLRDKEGEILFASNPRKSYDAIEALLDFALGIGGEDANYREVENGHELFRRCSELFMDEVIGSTASPTALGVVTAYFKRYGEAEGFHAVEHVLLRRRTSGDPFMPVQLDPAGACGCTEVLDPYSFRMTLVLPSWPWRFRDAKLRTLVEETLRREAPAHVQARICWISHAQMQDFEAAYAEWSARLAALDPFLGGCGDAAGRTGQMPLPAPNAGDAGYGLALARLIETMHRLVNVHPLARLHDGEDTQGDQPRISLNNTSLGTF